MRITLLILSSLLLSTCAEEVPFRERPYTMVETLPVKYSFPSNGKNTATFSARILSKSGQISDYGFVWARELTFESYPDRQVSNSLSKSISFGPANLNTNDSFTHTVEYVLPTNQFLDWEVWAYVKSNGFTYYGPKRILECCTR